MSAETKIKLTIPQTIEVDASRVQGDATGHINFEVLPGEYPEDKLSEYEREAFRKGARVFVTEDDDYLILLPETSPSAPGEP